MVLYKSVNVILNYIMEYKKDGIKQKVKEICFNI